MLQVQERVARVEGRVEAHARMLTDVAGAVRHLEARMDQRFTSVEQRFTSVDQRFTSVDQHFGALNGRMTALDQKIDRKTDALERRIDAVEKKMDSHFLWLVGIQFATLIAIIASVAAG